MTDTACVGAVPVETETTTGRYGSPWFWGACALLVLGLADLWLCGTVLISPIDPVLLNGFRAIGALIGFAMALELAAMPLPKNRPGNRIVLMLVVPFMVGMLFDAFAWHLVDRVRFVGSTAAFETAVYPVLGLHRSNKGGNTSLTIDPFQTGEPAHIPISHQQYAELRGQTGLCVTVRQRRGAGGAVQLLIRPSADQGIEPTRVQDCASANAWR